MNYRIWPFGILSAIYLVLLLVNEEFAWYLKPLLIVALIYAIKPTGLKDPVWLTAALIASWIGDIVLMFVDRGSIFFIVGLVAFLLAHLSYIMVFIKTTPRGNTFNKSVYRMFAIGVGLYLCLFLTFLIPYLGSMTLPVVVYGIVISLMLLLAIRFGLSTPSPYRQLIPLGAALFVTSDSLLAINKFVSNMEGASIMIMATYLAAQCLLAVGIARYQQENSH